MKELVILMTLQFDVYSIGRIGLLTKLNDDRKCKIK